MRQLACTADHRVLGTRLTKSLTQVPLLSRACLRTKGAERSTGWCCGPFFCSCIIYTRKQKHRVSVHFRAGQLSASYAPTEPPPLGESSSHQP